ncbi:MAG: 3'(2'),5'-bisphosphate nucleotidase CysQ [Rickettsiales bacterium]|nr:3'(2'),5'-bisphosphate nucleotidase CysQ [Rickettsiales bacterium]
MLDQNQIDYIVNVAKQAGEVALGYFKNKSFQVSKKLDNSEVTCADIEISKFISSKFSQEFPDVAVICEEGNIRDHSVNTFFLVDPIDGTGGFAKFKDEFSINIALVENEKPTFGLIYAPLFDGGKIIYSNANDEVVIESGGKSNIVKKIDKIDGVKVITSQKTKDEMIKNFMRDFYFDIDEYDVLRVSSAVKFFYFIEGKVNLYLHFRPSMEWDIAAGQYLVELIGGEIKTLKITENNMVLGGNLTYNKKDYLNGPFIVRNYG